MWVVEHLGVGGAPLCLETSMDLTDELRMLAEDFHVNGYNRYSAAMSKAADELGSLQRYRTAYNEWIDKTEWVQESLPPKYLGMHLADALKDTISELEERTRRLESALHSVSLCSQNSTSSQRECGRIARAALEESK